MQKTNTSGFRDGFISDSRVVILVSPVAGDASVILKVEQRAHRFVLWVPHEQSVLL